MAKIKVLICDDSKECRKKIVDGLRSNVIEIVGEAADGEECLSMLEHTNVDVLVLDIIMPNVDGLETLERMRINIDSPKVIMYTDVLSDYFVNKSIQLGASYYLCKSSSIESLRKRIEDMNGNVQNMNNADRKSQRYYADDFIKRCAKPVEERIANIFIAVGIPAHIKGYQYLREAIMLCVKDPCMVNSITKRLYPALAEKFDTTSSRVERAIRHAIEVAWARGRVENINRIFGFKVYAENDRPTNGEFIALVADKLLLESKKAS